MCPPLHREQLKAATRAAFLMAAAKSSARLHSPLLIRRGAICKSRQLPAAIQCLSLETLHSLSCWRAYEIKMFLVDRCATHIRVHSGQRSVLLEKEFYQPILRCRYVRMQAPESILRRNSKPRRGQSRSHLVYRRRNGPRLHEGQRLHYPDTNEVACRVPGWLSALLRTCS
jgi:hypothetical protein